MLTWRHRFSASACCQRCKLLARRRQISFSLTSSRTSSTNSISMISTSTRKYLPHQCQSCRLLPLLGDTWVEVDDLPTVGDEMCNLYASQLARTTCNDDTGGSGGLEASHRVPSELLHLTVRSLLFACTARGRIAQQHPRTPLSTLTCAGSELEEDAAGRSCATPVKKSSDHLLRLQTPPGVSALWLGGAWSS